MSPRALDYDVTATLAADVCTRKRTGVHTNRDPRRRRSAPERAPHSATSRQDGVVYIAIVTPRDWFDRARATRSRARELTRI